MVHNNTIEGIPAEYADQRVGLKGYRVLNLDLDGVCADCSGALWNYLRRHGRVDPQMRPGLDEYALFRNPGWPFTTLDGYLAAHKEAEKEHLYATMPMIPGASEALRRLSRADVYIRVVTHRLFVSGQHRMVVADTAEWLDENAIPYMSLCFTGLKDSMQATVHIDDSPSNIATLRAVGQHVVVFDQPYNRDIPGPRIMSWNDQAVEDLLRWFEEWPES
jgi:5'(3')-deoxyribonucleotidase